jgi:YidC/Oxa1 family membrane protein insertase
MNMRAVLFLFWCFACYGRRVQNSIKNPSLPVSDQTKSLASLLFAYGVPAFALPPARTAPAALRRSNPATASFPTEHLGGGVGALDLGSMTTIAEARMTAEAILAASGEIGWWDSYIKLVEDTIFTLYDALSGIGIGTPYGLCIFFFVLAAKTITLPLNWQQYSSSAQLRAMKPQQDLIRKWYADNENTANIQIGTLFDKYDVNPLSGCLPSLAQIPIFLGVYYSVTAIAKAEIFTEGFLWIPSLSGPIADRREGISWLTEGWVDGVPKLGWEDTLAYLSIPAILVCTQTLSLYLLGSFDALNNAEDKSSQSAGVVIRLLPFFLGWVAMNAPAGLGLYWVFNNIMTTATTVTVKKLTERDDIDMQIDLATIGPRRAPLPMHEDSQWVRPEREVPQDADAIAETSVA